MSDEMLRPGDYTPAPEGIQRMFGGFATDRARVRARIALRQVAHPSVQTTVDLSCSPRPTRAPIERGGDPAGGERQRRY
jgi:hypothetical protein